MSTSALLAFFLLVLKTVGTKAPQVWPHLIHMAEDAKQILLIITDGKLPVMDASVAVTNDTVAAEFVKIAGENGIKEADARSVLAPVYALDERLK